MLKRLHLIALCVLCWLASGCSSGKNTSQTSAFMFTSPTSNPSIDVGQSVTLTVNEAATWSLQSGSGFGQPIGSLSNQTGTSVTYSVPSGTNLSAATQVTVVATSTADTTATAAMIVKVNPVVTLETVNTFLTRNQDCSYSPTLANNDGTVGMQYSQGTNVGTLSATGGTAPYTWSVSSGSLPAGLILQSTTGISCIESAPSCAFLSGTPVTPGCSQVQVQVTDATGVTATSPTYNVVITPAPLKVQVPDYTDLYANVPYPPTSLSVSGGTPPYTWSLADPVNNPLPSGISMTVVQGTGSMYLSGKPPLTSNLAPIFSVTDSQTPYAAIGQASLSFTQWSALPAPCAPAPGYGTSNVSLQGPYAFLARGFDSSGPVVIAGSFTADGTAAGNVTAGELDVMRSTGSQSALAIEPAGSSYTISEQVGDNGNFETRGCVTLATSASTMTFSFSLGGCTVAAGNFGLCGTNSQGNPGIFTTGRLIEFDAGTQLSGILRQQNTSAFSSGLSGPYTFGLSGRDSAGSRFASAGSFTASSTTLSSVAADINDAGTLQSTLTGRTGSASSVDGNGRATATLSVGNAAFDLVAYMVSASDVLLVSTGTLSASNPIVSGEAVGTTGSFSAASLQNGHMFHTAGLSSSGPDPTIGMLSFDGVDSFTGTQFEDQAGTLSTTPLSGSYTVDSSSGRFALNEGNNVVLHPLIGYAIPVPSTLTRQSCVQPWNCITGFLLSTDATAQAGLLEFQTPTTPPPPPFSSLYVSGYYFYGTDESLDPATPVLEGASQALPNGAVYTGIQSLSYSGSSFYCQLESSCAALFPDQTLASKSTYSVSSNGTASLGGETVAVTNGNVIFYIDESPINAHPAVVVAEQ